MQKHTKIYYEFFDYPIDPDFPIPSEISGIPAVDVNHISARGMGGSKRKDVIENLMAMTREEYEQYGDKKQYKQFLINTHREFMSIHRPDYKFKDHGKADKNG